MSVYEDTKRHLIDYCGIDRYIIGKPVLNDKKLFLLFVRLERAKRTMDFDAVYNSVQAIDDYTKVIGKREIMYFAYAYMRFRGNMSTKLERLPAKGQLPEGVMYVKEYRPKVEMNDIALVEWGMNMDDRCKRFYRALHKRAMPPLELRL